MTDTSVTPTPVTPPPADPVLDLTKFENLTLTAVRRPDGNRGAGWYLVTYIGDVEWIVAVRKLGGLDDDLQEVATPGYKEAAANRYARESGKQRTEPGPGAV